MSRLTLARDLPLESPAAAQAEERRLPPETGATLPPVAPPPVAEPAPLFDLIELMFFAYRDFVGDADRLLDTYGFGRAHHRVLHFVSRHPGMSVAELLDVLRITKQSLNRVMKELVDAGLVEGRSGRQDRRQRLLYPSPEGDRLVARLAALQSRRFRAALDHLSPGSRGQAADFLLGLVDAEDRAAVQAMIARARQP